MPLAKEGGLSMLTKLGVLSDGFKLFCSVKSSIRNRHISSFNRAVFSKKKPLAVLILLMKFPLTCNLCRKEIFDAAFSSHFYPTIITLSNCLCLIYIVEQTSQPSF